MKAADVLFREADPDEPSVAAILRSHIEFARSVTPPGHVHALDGDGLRHRDVTLFAAWVGDEAVGVGALRQLSRRHGEIKSMHTAAAWRGCGFGQLMLEHLLAEARQRGYERVSLETGTMAAFAPARRLYRSAGFRRCEPFADYEAVPNSVCMTLEL